MSSSNGGSNGTSARQETRSQRVQRGDEVAHHEGLVKVIEVLAESAHSWEDAAQNALNEAESSIRNIKSIYVKDMQAIVQRGEIVRWRLNAEISFAVEHHAHASRGLEGEGRSELSAKQRHGGRVMERMEEGRRHFREERDEGREQYEGQDEGRYRGQGGYRSSEADGRRGMGSEGWEHGEQGRNQNMGWRYGGEARPNDGRYAQERYGEDMPRYQGQGGYQPGMGPGGYSTGMGYSSGSRDPDRQGEYGENLGRGGQYGGDSSRNQRYGSSARFGGQETGGQYIGRQYRSNQLGGSQFGGGQYGQSGSGQYGGGQYGGGQYGQMSGRQFGGGQYGSSYGGGQFNERDQYGIERPGYFGESNMSSRRQGYQGEGYGRDDSMGRQIQEFGGAMAGRVRRMFKGPKGYKRSDDRIREDVCDVLSQVDEIDPSEIEVSVANGEVTLSGTVPERSMKWQAEQIVDNVSGVNDINNQLRVKRADSPATGMGSQQSNVSTSSTQASRGSSTTRS